MSSGDAPLAYQKTGTPHSSASAVTIPNDSLVILSNQRDLRMISTLLSTSSTRPMKRQVGPAIFLRYASSGHDPMRTR
jgi:hypothetical protein